MRPSYTGQTVDDAFLEEVDWYSRYLKQLLRGDGTASTRNIHVAGAFGVDTRYYVHGTAALLRDMIFGELRASGEWAVDAGEVGPSYVYRIHWAGKSGRRELWVHTPSAPSGR